MSHGEEVGTPKSFRELAREMRKWAAHVREGFCDQPLVAEQQAEKLERLCDEWERYSQNEYCPASIATKMLGAKEGR